jgi:cold shock CspA family protein/Cdc6-like AAA superfamily ATPase
MNGTVQFYSDYRGYGFVLGADKNEYFVHVSQIKSDDHKTLDKGQEISFTPVSTAKGLQAKDVVIIQQVQPDTPIKKHLTLKKNPFTPQSPIIQARKFAGRREALLNSIDALFNSKNVLVIGPRGIGKSSFSYQLMYLTEGETELLKRLEIDLGEFRFENLTGDHRCVPGNTLIDICSGLVSTFCESIDRLNEKRGKQKTSCTIDLKFFKLTSETETERVSPTDVSLAFVSKIEELSKEQHKKRVAVTFVLDEIDVLDPDVGIASFLKATSEKFHLNNIVDVSFIVSGVTGTITDLISQHPSVSRLFENVPLPRMYPAELENIIDIALEGTGVSITRDAKDEIITLSNQFPQPVHLLGYHSYRIDENGNIDKADVDDAKSLIVSEIKRQDFEARFDRIAPGPMTEVIRVVAQAPLETVNLNYLRANLRHMDDDKIIGTLGNFQKQGIIEKQHRGVYRLTDPLFKTYLRWLFGIETI